MFRIDDFSIGTGSAGVCGKTCNGKQEGQGHIAQGVGFWLHVDALAQKFVWDIAVQQRLVMWITEMENDCECIRQSFVIKFRLKI